MTVALSDSKKARYRKKLLKKGQQIATKLAEALAGLDCRLEDIAPSRLSEPGMTKEEKLRAQLDHIEACRKALERDDGTFGTCWRCKGNISEPELDEMPWADESAYCGRLGKPPECVGR